MGTASDRRAGPSTRRMRGHRTRQACINGERGCRLVALSRPGSRKQATQIPERASSISVRPIANQVEASVHLQKFLASAPMTGETRPILAQGVSDHGQVRIATSARSRGLLRPRHLRCRLHGQWHSDTFSARRERGRWRSPRCRVRGRNARFRWERCGWRCWRWHRSGQHGRKRA